MVISRIGSAERNRSAKGNILFPIGGAVGVADNILIRHLRGKIRCIEHDGVRVNIIFHKSG